MPTIHARQALLPSGWANDVEVHIADDGRIAWVSAAHMNVEIDVETEVGIDAPENASSSSPSAVPIHVDILLPAPVNAHSHAFQRAMAGLTEGRGPDVRDSFWTWRRLMYRFLDQLTPEHVEAITAFVQLEMLECGYATNVEFHYLHHRPDGRPYDAVAEMSERVAAAARTTGIGLTLLPVHYQYGGCDRRPLGEGQKRFGSDLAQYGDLFDGAAAALAELPTDAALGVAPHSLRAVAPESFAPLIELASGRPIHLHLAEQQAEVDEVSTAWSKRPVEWVLDTLDPGPQWCLIHCTRMLPHETTALAQTGAIAGLCPITEANLGDGIFDGCRWLDAGGQIAIGSDSNIRISLVGELRTLEYTQRLRDHTRAALATREKSVGRRLFDAVTRGGAQAAARACGQIAEGAWADLMSLDGHSANTDGLRGDLILDSYIFAGDDALVRDVWSAGRHVVHEGRHHARDAIEAAYRRTIRELRHAL
ncbi:MAG: formimidoylglutamate deiminase [Pseudomonadota bacterium]